MSKQPELIKELKQLGRELGAAINEMRRSKEFKALEKDLVTSAKTISHSVVTGVKAARKSESAHRLKSQLHKVIQAGTIEGKQEARKAQAAAAVGLRKVRQAIRDLRHRVDRNKD